MPAAPGQAIEPPPAYCGMFSVVPFQVAPPLEPDVVRLIAD
jgi:hypothetical protein